MALALAEIEEQAHTRRCMNKVPGAYAELGHILSTSFCQLLSYNTCYDKYILFTNVIYTYISFVFMN